VALVMVGAFGVWYVRRKRPRPTSGLRRPASDVERLVAELATLDLRFERAADAQTRETYERDRAALKDRIARALAEEKQPA
jgi:hypothetical protein